jgi:hypothetical protein
MENPTMAPAIGPAWLFLETEDPRLDDDEVMEGLGTIEPGGLGNEYEAEGKGAKVG